jgi:hypothetical protein
VKPVPLDLTPEQADEMLPVGTVLPFKPGEVPENWESFEGQSLYARDYPDLYFSLGAAEEIWEAMGGAITSDGILMPGPLTDEETNKLVWGMTMDKAVPMTLALKVRRRVRD